MPRICASWLFALVIQAALSLPAFAQSGTAGDMQPYTGPPIYLDAIDAVPSRAVENKVQKDTFKNGDPKIERGLTRFSDNSIVSNGVFKEYYPGGQLFVEGTFQDGKRSGEWTYWHRNGEVAKKVSYSQGQPDGKVEMYRADGSLLAKRGYQAGKRHGEWIRYAEDGQAPALQQNYSAGKPTGVWKWYYDSGKQMRETTFSEGQMSGVSREWSKEGQLRAEVHFKDGKRHGLATQWTTDGRKIEQYYDAGIPVRNQQ